MVNAYRKDKLKTKAGELELLKQYVKTFPKYDEEFQKHTILPRSFVKEFITPETELVKIEKSLCITFPALYRRLLLTYRYDAADLDSYSLLPNPSGSDFNGFKQKIFYDKHLWPTLYQFKLIQFGKRGKYDNYDPICFDTRNKNTIVQFDHEEILCNRRLKVIRKLADSFEELVRKTIENASKL
ncbi:MAG: SMI1/KNR4 family protein [Planctomycetes bacterium]|nr:SMI1/KNR4 family protein [Planctomycetota bacterium]